MTRKGLILTAGFSIFSMFFGSGNLVFPLLMGHTVGDHYLYGLLGLAITAVLVPFLALFSMILYDGNRQAFFSTLGKWPSFAVTAIILALMGPFGVVPRCITLAYGSFKVPFPEVSLFVFSLAFVAAIAALIWRQNRVVEIIGIFLTPWKLGGMIIVILASIWAGHQPIPAPKPALETVAWGAYLGYQTMDLIAGFFFSAAIVAYLRQHATSSKELFSMSLKASTLGACLLMLVYYGFVTMGARHSIHFTQAGPDELLTLISGYSLGNLSTVIVSLTITVACLATAVILSELFVEFIQTDISQGKISHPWAIVITCILSLAMSMLGFKTIMSFLATILSFAYPALIAFTLASILDKLFNKQTAGFVFWLSIACSVFYQLWLSYGAC